MPATGPLILVDRLEDFVWPVEGRRIMLSRDFIAPADPDSLQADKIINLSRSYEYLGYGYYTSLLAEARRMTVFPSAETILDMQQRGRGRPAWQVLERLLRETVARLKEPPEHGFTLHVFFGRSEDPRFDRLGRMAFDRFRCPILRLKIQFLEDEGWRLKSLRPMTISELGEEQHEAFGAALDSFTRARWRKQKAARFNLAILHDPAEAMPPSDPDALNLFIEAGKQLGIAVELIRKKDEPRLAEFDALFIRETTAIDHHSFRFARKMADEGKPVIDDPGSILRCTNKVYLAELLKARKIPTPRTIVMDRRRVKTVEQELNWPMVLKVPDGSFSRGVVKVRDRKELVKAARELFRESDVILAQEFMPTEFDWRIGLLNNEPIFACKYEMAAGHWQIYHHLDEQSISGGFKTIPVEDTPAQVLDVARKSARLMGNGLYGVDLKQTKRGVFVVEVNDNPNVDSEVEDAVLGEKLYRMIMAEFLNRLEKKQRGYSEPRTS